MELHHLDGNHDNNKNDNLVTICPLCHQCHHLMAASVTNGGRIIYLPEISQTDLNHLCRMMMVMMKMEEDAKEYVGAVKSLYSALESRSNLVESVLGEGASDPGMFGRAMMMLSEEGGKPGNTLKDFKLLASYSRFEQAVSYWAKSMKKDFPPSAWKERFLDKGVKTEDILNAMMKSSREDGQPSGRKDVGR